MTKKNILKIVGATTGVLGATAIALGTAVVIGKIYDKRKYESGKKQLKEDLKKLEQKNQKDFIAFKNLIDEYYAYRPELRVKVEEYIKTIKVSNKEQPSIYNYAVNEYLLANVDQLESSFEVAILEIITGLIKNFNEEYNKNIDYFNQYKEILENQEKEGYKLEENAWNKNTVSYKTLNNLMDSERSNIINILRMQIVKDTKFNKDSILMPSFVKNAKLGILFKKLYAQYDEFKQDSDISTIFKELTEPLKNVENLYLEIENVYKNRPDEELNSINFSKVAKFLDSILKAKLDSSILGAGVDKRDALKIALEKMLNIIKTKTAYFSDINNYSESFKWFTNNIKDSKTTDLLNNIKSTLDALSISDEIKNNLNNAIISSNNEWHKTGKDIKVSQLFTTSSKLIGNETANIFDFIGQFNICNTTFNELKTSIAKDLKIMSSTIISVQNTIYDSTSLINSDITKNAKFSINNKAWFATSINYYNKLKTNLTNIQNLKVDEINVQTNLDKLLLVIKNIADIDLNNKESISNIYPKYIESFKEEVQNLFSSYDAKWTKGIDSKWLDYPGFDLDNEKPIKFMDIKEVKALDNEIKATTVIDIKQKISSLDRIGFNKDTQVTQIGNSIKEWINTFSKNVKAINDYYFVGQTSYNSFFNTNLKQFATKVTEDSNKINELISQNESLNDFNISAVMNSLISKMFKSYTDEYIDSTTKMNWNTDLANAKLGSLKSLVELVEKLVTIIQKQNKLQEFNFNTDSAKHIKEDTDNFVNEIKKTIAASFDTNSLLSSLNNSEFLKPKDFTKIDSKVIEEKSIAILDNALKVLTNIDDLINKKYTFDKYTRGIPINFMHEVTEKRTNNKIKIGNVLYEYFNIEKDSTNQNKLLAQATKQEIYELVKDNKLTNKPLEERQKISEKYGFLEIIKAESFKPELIKDYVETAKINNQEFKLKSLFETFGELFVAEKKVISTELANLLNEFKTNNNTEITNKITTFNTNLKQFYKDLAFTSSLIDFNNIIQQNIDLLPEYNRIYKNVFSNYSNRWYQRFDGGHINSHIPYKRNRRLRIFNILGKKAYLLCANPFTLKFNKGFNDLEPMFNFVPINPNDPKHIMFQKALNSLYIDFSKDDIKSQIKAYMTNANKYDLEWDKIKIKFDFEKYKNERPQFFENDNKLYKWIEYDNYTGFGSLFITFKDKTTVENAIKSQILSKSRDTINNYSLPVIFTDKTGKEYQEEIQCLPLRELFNASKSEHYHPEGLKHRAKFGDAIAMYYTFQGKHGDDRKNRAEIEVTRGLKDLLDKHKNVSMYAKGNEFDKNIDHYSIPDSVEIQDDGSDQIRDYYILNAPRGFEIKYNFLNKRVTENVLSAIGMMQIYMPENNNFTYLYFTKSWGTGESVFSSPWTPFVYLPLPYIYTEFPEEQ